MKKNMDWSQILRELKSVLKNEKILKGLVKVHGTVMEKADREAKVKELFEKAHRGKGFKYVGYIHPVGFAVLADFKGTEVQFNIELVRHGDMFVLEHTDTAL